MISSFISFFTALPSDSSWWVASKIFMAVLVIIIAGSVANWLLIKLVKFSERSSTQWDNIFLEDIRRPLTTLIWVVGITYTAELGWHDLTANIQDLVIAIRKLGVIICIAWFALRFLRSIEAVLIAKYADKPEHEGFDAVGIRAANKVFRASIIVTTALVAFSSMGYSISGIIAFGGIGGIAIGFAAKDLLANFFGGLMIYLDRPFTEGDWIRSPDREIEGIVEQIGWRQTRIRTFERRPVYVPNSIFAQIAVENPSRMENRRFREFIGVRYRDISKVSKIVEDIKQMLRENKSIDHEKLLIVGLDKFDASSVNILVYTYATETNGAQFYKLKQEIMLNIAEIVERHGAEIAFPTHTLYVKTQQDADNG